jgi:hypothetical protein
LNLAKNKVYLETMKCVGKIAIWLAGGLVLSAGAQADNIAVVSAGNPYTPIATRNIFGLNPVSAETPTGDPPPKITLNGIMSIHGRSQALYKVAGTGKPGQPAKDQFYNLSEGQRQDDVEVLHINNQAGLVTFNNHGAVQEIPLANAPAVTTSAPGPGGQVSRAAFGRPMGGSGGGNVGNEAGNFSGRGGAARQNRGRGNDANQNPNLSPNSAPIAGGLTMQSMQAVPTRATTYNPPQNPLTPDEQVVQAANLLLNTAKLKSDGNPTWQIMPPVPGAPPMDP